MGTKESVRRPYDNLFHDHLKLCLLDEGGGEHMVTSNEVGNKHGSL